VAPASPVPGARAPAPSATPARAQPPATAGQGAFYLQLAAFSTRDNAEAARARLARQLDWMSEQLVVRAEGGMFKVQAGPYRQRADALAAAERVRQATDYKPFPVAR
jgi:rare lipoprotein A